LLELAGVSADSVAVIDLMINQMPGLVSGFSFGAIRQAIDETRLQTGYK